MLGRLLMPEERPGGPSAGVRALRRVTVALWVAVVAVQVVIWVVSMFVAGELEFPWWIWSVGSGAVFVGGLWWITGRKSSADVTG